MVPRSTIRLSALVLGVVAMPSGAQRPSGVLFGVVRDSAGVAIPRVEIAVIGSAVRATSGDSGSYRLNGLTAGTVRIQLRRLGYAAETTAVVLGDGERRELTLALTHAVPARMDAVVVDERTRGKMAAFHARRARGVGAFVTREEIEARSPPSISELLRYLPGVGVMQRMAGEPQPVRMQRSINTTMQQCTVQLYVDGQRYEHGNVDDFPPANVEGVEVYRSAAEVPAAFRARDATCGVIGIWTRDPDAVRRKP